MRRRLFITLCGGAIGLPARAYPQQQENVRLIGVLIGPANSAETETWFGAFRQKLKELGWIEGGNTRVDVRWGAGDMNIIRAHSAELVRSRPDVIVCFSVRVARTLRDLTTDIPVVFMATADPVAQGLVKSFTHPGGNLTGFTLYEFSIAGKLVELLKEVVPKVARVGFLFNQENTSAKGYLRTLEKITPKLGIVLVPLAVRDAATIEDAVSRFASEPNDALLVPPDVTTRVYRDHIIALAERLRLPAIYSSRADVAAGGLMSYGPDFRWQFRGAAVYVDRILRGEKPAGLPVQAPAEYALFINQKTARKLRIAIPTSILARADEVIE